jgi:glycosyltransferase involved in cell wall biosynthesis
MPVTKVGETSMARNDTALVKVAQVCSTYHPHIGGVETHVRSIAERLVKQGLSVDVLTTDPTGRLAKEELVNGVLVRRFRGWAPGNAYYFSSGLMCHLMRSCRRYDVVHAHNYGTLPAAYAALACGECKLVFTPHYHGTASSWARTLLRVPYGLLWMYLLRRVDALIFVSRVEELSFRTRFIVPDDRTVVIPNGIDAEAILAAGPYDVDAPVVLHVGRLEKYKNVHRIVEAMRYLDERYLLCIVGDGPYKGDLLRLARSLCLQSRVRILSGLTDHQVHRWYRTCQVFVTLSSLEAFGITVLEAAAAGKPIVASDIPAFRELANKLHGMRLVNTSSMTCRDIAEAIGLSAQAGEVRNDLEMFTWDTIAASVRRVYDHVADAGRRNA